MLFVVDNTNCSAIECAPYIQAANSFDVEVNVLTLLGHPTLTHPRNKHNVPYEKALKQYLTLKKSIREWPPWWPQHIFPVTA